MSNEKDIIEYTLHAYDTFWEYYKKSLDERNNILNNYMIFVGIPISIIGVFIDKIKNNFDNYLILIVLLLIIIFILGLVMYSIYIIEGLVSQRYLQRINHITQYLINNFDRSYHNVFKETYELGSLFLDNNYSKKQRLNKSFIIIIVNTIIIIGIFILLCGNTTWYQILLPTVFSIVTHIFIFVYYNKKIKHN